MVVEWRRLLTKLPQAHAADVLGEAAHGWPVDGSTDIVSRAVAGAEDTDKKSIAAICAGLSTKSASAFDAYVSTPVSTQTPRIDVRNLMMRTVRVNDSAMVPMSHAPTDKILIYIALIRNFFGSQISSLSFDNAMKYPTAHSRQEDCWFYGLFSLSGRYLESLTCG